MLDCEVEAVKILWGKEHLRQSSRQPRIFEEHLNINCFNFTIRTPPRNGNSNSNSAAIELLEEFITAHETSESDRKVIDDLPTAATRIISISPE